MISVVGHDAAGTTTSLSPTSVFWCGRKFSGRQLDKPRDPCRVAAVERHGRAILRRGTPAPHYGGSIFKLVDGRARWSHSKRSGICVTETIIFADAEIMI